MTFFFKFFDDAGLSVESSGISAAQSVDGNADPVDTVVYLGSTIDSYGYRENENPGVNDIIVSVADSATGSGVEAADVKLALSLAGLDSATGGAALSVGTTILGGVGNAIPIYVRIDTPALTAGTYDDVSLTTNTVVQYVL